MSPRAQLVINYMTHNFVVNNFFMTNNTEFIRACQEQQFRLLSDLVTSELEWRTRTIVIFV